MLPNIFLVIGGAHSDPMLPIALDRIVTHLRTLQLPVYFAHEAPCDVSLDDAISHCDREIKAAMFMLQLPAIQALIRTDLPKSAFKLDAYDSIKTELSKVLSGSGIKIADIDSTVQSIFCHCANMEKLNLLKQLKTKGIPFFGIEAKEEVRSAYLDEAGTVLDKRLAIENDRIATMLEKIDASILPLMDTAGGITVCNVGYLHAERLTAHLTQQHPRAHVICIRASSEYRKQSLPGFQQIITNSHKIDAPEILALYQKLNVLNVAVAEVNTELSLNPIMIAVLKLLCKPLTAKLMRVKLAKSLNPQAILKQLHELNVHAFPSEQDRSYYLFFHTSQLSAVKNILKVKSVVAESKQSDRASAAATTTQGTFALPSAQQTSPAAGSEEVSPCSRKHALI